MAMTTFAAQRQDLSTVRFAWSPLWETLLAVRVFIDPRGRPYHRTWHAAMTGEAARLRLTELFAVSPLRGSVPDFLTPPPHVPAPRFRDQLSQIRATPLGQVTEELRRCRETLTGGAQGVLDTMLADPATARDLLAGQVQAAWERLVAPFWPRIRAVLDADVAHRSRQLTDHGLRPMLEGIDARITWGDGTVVVNDGTDVTVELRGRGLVLLPSAYIWPVVTAIVDEPWQPTISYPARGIADLWQEAAPPPDALVRLLGRTRALLLARLDQPASTGTLAALHGLSPSGTSRHLIAMRDAGLISGTRHGHEIRYARTRLGTELSRAAAGGLPRISGATRGSLSVAAEQEFPRGPGHVAQGLLEVDGRPFPAAGEAQVIDDRIHDFQPAAVLGRRGHRLAGGSYRSGSIAGIHHLDDAAPVPGARQDLILVAGTGVQDDVSARLAQGEGDVHPRIGRHAEGFQAAIEDLTGDWHARGIAGQVQHHLDLHGSHLR